jgi:hypothetical protein
MKEEEKEGFNVLVLAIPAALYMLFVLVGCHHRWASLPQTVMVTSFPLLTK